MKHLVPVPPESAKQLKKGDETGPGYQFVSVRLKDGRTFEHAVASEGYIIQVKGHKDVPFTEAEVGSVKMNDKPWNFRRRWSTEEMKGEIESQHL